MNTGLPGARGAGPNPPGGAVRGSGSFQAGVEVGLLPSFAWGRSLGLLTGFNDVLPEHTCGSGSGSGCALWTRGAGAVSLGSVADAASGPVG